MVNLTVRYWETLKNSPSRSLDKITINDLTSDCGISWMAFLSFQGYYDLVGMGLH